MRIRQFYRIVAVMTGAAAGVLLLVLDLKGDVVAIPILMLVLVGALLLDAHHNTASRAALPAGGRLGARLAARWQDRTDGEPPGARRTKR